jgi:AcrR family transcriptional regulator
VTEVVERPAEALRSRAPKAAERVSRRMVDKFAARRDELAAAALQTLSELGYARTSLREIAQNSEFSHGVLHYYFTDKADLITHCVRQYKAGCVTRYDDLVAAAGDADGLAAAFGAAMAASMRDDGPMHRLWYDLRNQSMFEDWFRADAREIDASLEAMIWRVVSRYAELAGAPPGVDAATAYALLDGLFQQALHQHLTGGGPAADGLAATVERFLPRLLDRG